MWVLKDQNPCGFNFREEDGVRILVAGDDGLIMCKSEEQRAKVATLLVKAMNGETRKLPFKLKEIILIDKLEQCGFFSKLYFYDHGKVTVAPRINKIWENGLFIPKSKSLDLATNPFMVCIIKAYTAKMVSPLLYTFFIWLAQTNPGSFTSEGDMMREARMWTKMHGVHEGTFTLTAQQKIEELSKLSIGTILDWATGRRVMVGLKNALEFT